MPTLRSCVLLLVKFSIAQSVLVSEGLSTSALSLVQTKALSVTRSQQAHDRSSQSQSQTLFSHPSGEFTSVVNRPSEFTVSGDDGESIELSRVDRLWGKNGKCLSFIHIPKNAGTSIEAIGRTRSVKWGNSDLTNNQCTRPGAKWAGDNSNCYVKNTTAMCSAWHVPPAYDSKLLRHLQECETFCVARNPSTRLVSQWQWHHHNDPCNVDYFRAYVLESFAESNTDPYIQDCHLLPQVEYVYDADGAEVCQHVLEFENLEKEFNALMQKFDMKLTLSLHAFASNCTLQLPTDLVDMIKKRYHHDFHTFKYK